MAEPITVATMGKAIAAAWSRGSLVLWSLAAASLAAAVALGASAYLGVPKAAAIWNDYGLILIIAAPVLAVLAAFKTYSESLQRSLSLIADEEQSLWGRSKQPDGRTITQFTLRFQATNTSDSAVLLSGIRLKRPCVRREFIVTAVLMTQHPSENTYSGDFPIGPHSLSRASATIIVDRAIAKDKRAMRVVAEVQDQNGRWHKLVFPYLKNPMPDTD